MGNCNCFEEEGDVGEFNSSGELPTSFIILAKEDLESGKHQILDNILTYLQEVDSGRDSPNDVHVPLESDTIRKIRSFPKFYQEKFELLNANFGEFEQNPMGRMDKFKVVSSPPLEIVLSTKLEEDHLKPKKGIVNPTAQSSYELEIKHKSYSTGRGKTIVIPEENQVYQYYEGEWRKGKMHGYGKLVTLNGNCYQGFLQSGVPNGRGRLRYANGDTFDGYFVKGILSGQGVLYGVDGSKIKGNFVQNLPNGESIIFVNSSLVEETHPRGFQYSGSYKNGKKEGNGVLTLPNEDRILGVFHDNLLEGEATILYTNGNQFKGRFVGNRRDGEGHFTYLDGRAFIGNYSFDIRQGEGKLVYLNSDVFAGTWENKKMDGVFRFLKQGKTEIAKFEFSKGRLVKGEASQLPPNYNF